MKTALKTTMKTTSVDEFVERRVLPQHRPIVEMLRQMMRVHAAGAVELITYGILGWKGTKVLAVVSPTKKDITFAFSRGGEFEDKYGLLQGVGRVSKHLKLTQVDGIEPAALKYYIKQAVKLDRRPD